MGDPAGSDTTGHPEGAVAETPEAEGASTVGTGSVLGIGCLVAVILLILIAIAFRWSGGSW